jgi:serine phosphatase RsbU (regulator of sigma subunit)
MDINQLRKVSVFARLPEDEAQRLMDVFRAREYPAGATLFEEGDPGDCFTIVLAGETEIVKALGTPEERLISVVAAGDYLGEMSLLYPDGLRSASARARTPVQTLELPRADFEALLDRHPRLAFELTREMVARLRKAENAFISDLQEKNRQLAQAYDELKAAQDQLIEQEKLALELDIAHQIQASLLPRELPDIPGWRVSAYWQPARAVGGDFYDFHHFPDGRFGLVIGDVSGKGVPAALVMASTRSVLRDAAEDLVSPGAVLEHANTLLCEDMPPNMFVTCLYALLDPASGVLDFANAGHNLPYLYSPDGLVELRATGMPLGLLPGMSYEQPRSQISAGQALLMYSDGLTEAHNPNREMFGLERLHTFLAHWQPPADPEQTSELIPSLLEALAAFTGPGWEREDDVTLLSFEPDLSAASNH